MGVYWTTMRQDVYSYVRACTCGLGKEPTKTNAMTLFQINTIAPKWASTIVEYLTKKVYPEKMSKVRQRYLQKQAQDFCIIAEQLYYRGKDGILRICVLESEYVSILEHAHAGIPGGHFLADGDCQTLTAKAIIRAGLWWPTLFQDAALYVKSCDECQRTKVPIRRDNIPLRPAHYPQLGRFWDLYSESLEEAEGHNDMEEVKAFVVETIRRFKPQIVVTHDLNGEYGHGMHRMIAKAVADTAALTGDASQYADSASRYGAWAVPKTYLHLYWENQIVLPTREPLSDFGGRTVLQVCKDAFEKHGSQQGPTFWVDDGYDDDGNRNDYQYSCAEYGLYRTTVGTDTGSSMLENLVTYDEQERQEAETATEPETETQKVPDKEKKSGSGKILWIIILIVVILLIIVIIILLMRRKAAKERQRRQHRERLRVSDQRPQRTEQRPQQSSGRPQQRTQQKRSGQAGNGQRPPSRRTVDRSNSRNTGRKDNR